MRAATLITMDNGRQYTLKELAALYGEKIESVRSRYWRDGKPQKWSEDRAKGRLRQAIPERVPKNKGFRPWDSLRKKLNYDTAYDNPNYLPDIPHGDLEHLSDTKNTGAGRGEYMGYYPKQAQSSFCGKSSSGLPVYQGRQ